MNRISKVAGFAAALFLALGTFNATPSWAWQVDLPVTPAVITTTTPLPNSIANAPVAPAPANPVAHESVLDGAVRTDAAEPPVHRTLAEMVAARASSRAADAEQSCLATAVYFEAKSESLKGQLGVAHVILNRTRSGRFPRTICGVVRQPGQFSFVRGGHLPAIAHGGTQWRTAVAVAAIALAGDAPAPAPKALFFHARYVAPSWHGVTRVAMIGNHVFYR